MRIHHLSCGSMCPFGSRVLPSVFPRHIVCHCLLIETGKELVLVDTGFGVDDLRNKKRLGYMSRLLGVKHDEQLAAINQIRKLGFNPNDVRHIILTHMDFDHAGGIADFPQATVHLMKEEYDAAMRRSSFALRMRYKDCQWSASTKWRVHEQVTGEPWHGFDAVRQIEGLPPELLIVPLKGHTAGHAGIAVEAAEGWQFHVGDAYYDHRELEYLEKRSLRLNFFQRSVHVDFKMARNNQQRLKELVETSSDDISVFCSHDPEEYERANTSSPTQDGS